MLQPGRVAGGSAATRGQQFFDATAENVELGRDVRFEGGGRVRLRARPSYGQCDEGLRKRCDELLLVAPIDLHQLLTARAGDLGERRRGTRDDRLA